MHGSIWQKYVVVLFLLWTAVDISVPGLCNSEQEIIRDGQFLIASANTKTAPVTQSGPEDDCFCCCSHIIATPHTELVTVLDVRSVGVTS
ncbi:MAG: hypothetical protein ACRD4T_12555, partial [Candidatus Acidiferrales bacterium]